MSFPTLTHTIPKAELMHSSSMTQTEGDIPKRGLRHDSDDNVKFEINAEGHKGGDDTGRLYDTRTDYLIYKDKGKDSRTMETRVERFPGNDST